MKDRTAVNHNIRKHFNELIYNTARYTEIALSIVIIIVIALSGLRLILTTAGTSIMDMDTSFFTSFLSQALSLVVGVEFVKMPRRHTAGKITAAHDTGAGSGDTGVFPFFHPTKADGRGTSRSCTDTDRDHRYRHSFCRPEISDDGQ